MRKTHDIGFVRTDIWREGQYLDLWSVVHFLSGISLAFGMWFIHFPTRDAIIIAALLLTAYEMFEVIAKIEETVSNRICDVLVGLTSFIPMTLWALPVLTPVSFYSIGVTTFVLNIFLSYIGWRESQKAYELEQKVRAEIAKERVRMQERREKIRARIMARKLRKRARH